MATRNENHDDLTKFGNRLWKLMEAKKIDTPRKLAIELRKNNLVDANTKHNDYNSEQEEEKNKIGSIEKKIRKHIEATNTEKVQGEFIVAYSKYFNCSADYLFGLTDIKTDMPEIRKICELTGLTESSIKSICRITSGKSLIVNGDFSNKTITTALNLLLEYSGLYKYLTCLCYVSESLQTVKTNELFENVLNNIPEKYRDAAVELFFDAEGAINKGIKPTQKLLGYANELDDAAYKESTSNNKSEALKEYKSNKYDLEENHRKMAEEIVNNLMPLLASSSNN